MTDIKKVGDAYGVAGQPTPEDLKTAAEQGFKSVLNLRSLDEATALPDEQEHAKAAGLHYANVPLSSSTPNQELTHKALNALDELPKPVLIHCGVGGRAGGIALIATAKEQGWTLAQLTQTAKEAGLNLEQPHLKQFIQQTYGDEDPSS